MHLKRIAITLTGMFLAACMYAQTDRKFFLAYDAGFMTTLDNRAYDLTDLDNSFEGFQFSLKATDFYYESKLLDKLSLRFQVNCHFNGGFAGWQQIVELKYKFGN